ncbi:MULTISPECIES: HD domain-containing protein [unclassified Helicobacter]|uniref:HD domain-containing protein n=1 Tax=unclassified Helicobacter TaxID=2593540 RepID=UPI0021639D71|nr:MULTISPECIES: HD domain-containing protein [unclassified Helicobacter]
MTREEIHENATAICLSNEEIDRLPPLDKKAYLIVEYMELMPYKINRGGKDFIFLYDQQTGYVRDGGNEDLKDYSVFAIKDLTQLISYSFFDDYGFDMDKVLDDKILTYEECLLDYEDDEEEEVNHTPSLVMNASGKLIDPFNLKESDFDVNVIAQTLSRICRFWGQTSRFYSVAQHCLVMVEIFDGQPELQKWALLHEVYEGLTGMDIPSPIKHSPHMQNYRLAEEKALEQMAKIFGLTPPMPEAIKTADKRLMVTEALELMNTTNYDWTAIQKPYGKKIRKLIKEESRDNDMSLVELRFLRKFNELFN